MMHVMDDKLAPISSDHFDDMTVTTAQLGESSLR